MSGSSFQTDALRPSSLPTATLGRRRHQDGTDQGDAVPTEDLDKVAEDWNLRIDKEVKSVSSGLKELIELADIGETPNVDTAQINSLHLKLKTSQLVRSAQGLRDIAHELKLMLLLSNQVEEVSRRDREAAEVGKEVQQGRKAVAQGIARLLGAETVTTTAEQPAEVPETQTQTQGREDGGGIDIDRTPKAADEDDKIAIDETDRQEEAGDEDDEDEFELVA